MAACLPVGGTIRTDLILALALALTLPACPQPPADDDVADDDVADDDVADDDMADDDVADDDMADDDSAVDDDDSGAEVVPCPEGLQDAVTTSTGCVQGERVGGLTVFRGVPYAASPVGPLRWRRTEPVEPWSEPLPALAFGPVCPQTNGTLGGDLAPGDGDEDCLYLNVWTPDPDGALPVLFFTHGGGHVDGAGSQALYDGTELADRGAVVVTHNYRLASLGFLAHPLLTGEDPGGTSGNQGLFDTLEALRWVHDNAAAFGGDPDRVLVFGESAGALTSCALLAMPQAEGLFSSAVIQSGPCGSLEKPLSDPSAADETAEEFGERFAQELGCAGEADVLACMRAASTGEILATLPGRVGLTGQGEAYGPNVDGVLLPAPARELIAAGGLHDIAVLAGTNADEATIFTAGWAIDTAGESQALVAWFAGLLGLDVAETMALYAPDAYESPRAALNAFYGDAIFHCPSRSFLRAAGAYLPAWQYSFTHVRSFMEDWGACHGCELSFLFGTGQWFTADERALSGAMQEAWVALAAEGSPSASATGPWLAFGSDPAEPFMELNTPAQAGSGWRAEQCDFLDAQGWHQYP